MSDECDWAGNGLSLSSSQSRGVTPVYLRCSQGRIKWTYPRGALRVLVRLPSPEREFRGCIKISDKFSGARLYLEGQRSLSPLYSENDGAHKQLIRCFHSRNGQAAIYVEAVDNVNSFKREVAEFSYDLQQLPRSTSANIMDLISDECRPCTKHEMAHAYCTSDLVTRGSIREIDDKPELELTQLTVHVIKLLRHSTDDNVIQRHENEVDDKYTSVRLNIPRHCEAQNGDGEFVFMARNKLGDLTITCAPRLETWVEVVRTMNKDGTSHCVLAAN